MFKLAFEKFPRFCGNFSINGSADQGKDGGAGRVFPQQGGQQQGEQQVDKVLGGKPLVKCPGAHLGVLGQHSEEELLDVRPGPLHSTLAGVQFLLGKAESVDGEKARVGLAALLQPLKQPCHAGEQVRKGPGVLGKAEDLLPNALHRGGHQLGLGAETVIDRPHRDPAGRGDRADVESGPALLLEEGSAGLQDGLVRGDGGIHGRTPFKLNNVQHTEKPAPCQVSFMENAAGWHGKAPNDEEYEIAMADLEKAGEALCQK